MLNCIRFVLVLRPEFHAREALMLGVENMISETADRVKLRMKRTPCCIDILHLTLALSSVTDVDQQPVVNTDALRTLVLTLDAARAGRRCSGIRSRVR
eukprot:2126317-Rhodomonas_salina.1